MYVLYSGLLMFTKLIHRCQHMEYFIHSIDFITLIEKFPVKRISSLPARGVEPHRLRDQGHHSCCCLPGAESQSA